MASAALGPARPAGKPTSAGRSRAALGAPRRDHLEIRDRARRAAAEYPRRLVASPSMPWVLGTGLSRPSGAYHLVWSRDLYQIATALLAAGDRAGGRPAPRLPVRPPAGARRLVPAELAGRRCADWTERAARRGRVPDRARLAARSHRPCAFPTRQAGRRLRGQPTARAPRRSAGRTRTATRRPRSPPRSPAWSAPPTSRARNGDPLDAAALEATADDWQRGQELDRDPRPARARRSPYYLRLTKDGDPNAGTTYDARRQRPGHIDQRAVVDPSFLELVRLGVSPRRPGVRYTLAVVDRLLGLDPPKARSGTATPSTATARRPTAPTGTS